MIEVSEVLALLFTLAGVPLMLLTFMAASILVAAQDWRLLLAALMAQTIGLATFSTRLLPAEWAVLQVLTVGLVSIMWFISARTVARQMERKTVFQGIWQDLRRRRWHPHKWGMDWRSWFAPGLRTPFRVFAVLIMGLLAYAFRSRLVLPNFPTDLNLVFVWVLVMALLGIVLSDDPFRIGLALISGLTAFQIVYLNLSPSTIAVGVLDGIEIMLGLSCSYLILARGAEGWNVPARGEWE